MLEEAPFTAGDLMASHVTTIGPEASLGEAVELMVQSGISGMPVVDAAGTIVGILSEGDLLRWHEGYSERQSLWLDALAEGSTLAPDLLDAIREQNRKVRLVMSPGAITVTEDMPARDVARLMYARHIKRVPVLRDGKLVGIVTRADLMRALALRLGEKTAGTDVKFASVNEALRRRREEGPA